MASENFMSLKAQLEAIIYAAETPITLEQMISLVKETVVAEGAADEAEIKSRVRSSLEELVGEYGSPSITGLRFGRLRADTGCRPSRSSTKWCARLRRV